jgi:hypothetical protein
MGKELENTARKKVAICIATLRKEETLDEFPWITQYLQESLEAAEKSLARDHRQWLGMQSFPADR